MKALMYLIAVVLLIGFGIGMWQLARTWNYNVSYKAMVKKTIVEMVKEEALKNPPKTK
jgi:cytochrome oxidase assembly protein ShyY1